MQPAVKKKKPGGGGRRVREKREEGFSYGVLKERAFLVVSVNASPSWGHRR